MSPEPEVTKVVLPAEKTYPLSPFEWEWFQTENTRDGQPLVGLRMNTVTGFTVVYLSLEDHEAILVTGASAKDKLTERTATWELAKMVDTPPAP